MANFTGIVKKVGCFPLKEKDKYENINRLALQVEIDGVDTWVSMGATKLDGFMVEEDGWKVLGEGSEVVFKYTKNGDYINSSKNDLMVLKFVEGKKFEKKEEAAKPTASGSTSGAPAKGGWNNNQARITFGMCMNNACNQLGAKYTPETLKARIVELHALAEEGAALAEKGELSTWGTTKVVVATKPKAKEASKPKVDTSSDTSMADEAADQSVYDSNDAPF